MCIVWVLYASPFCTDFNLRTGLSIIFPSRLFLLTSDHFGLAVKQKLLVQFDLKAEIVSIICIRRDGYPMKQMCRRFLKVYKYE